MRRAVGTLIHGLLYRASSTKGYWLYRSFASTSFSRGYVGYKPFIKTFNAFAALGYIEVKRGFFDRSEDGTGTGEATRFRPTAKFIELAEKYTVTPSNYGQHFEPVTREGNIVTDVVRVRASKKDDWRDPQRGNLMPVDTLRSDVASMIDRMTRINTYFSKQSFDGCTVGGFYRLYNQGDAQNFDYNKGGRLYAVGNFQRIERKERTGILINGEPVVEVDVSGSHLTLLHAMLGVPLHPAFDPYDMPGVPRAVVKKFIVASIGNGKFQRRWSPTIAAEYEKDHGEKLHLAHPLKATQEAILKHLPALAGLPESGITWADLQYRESLGLIATVEALAYEHDVPALPLHDSVIVPASKENTAKEVMKEAFQQYAGTSIRVSTK